VQILANEETERFMRIGLFQGYALKNTSSDQQHTALNRKEIDPSLFCSAHKKNRFYIFTRRRPEIIGEKTL